MFPQYASRARFEIGRVLSTALGMIGANFWRLYGALLAVWVAMTVVQYAVRLGMSGYLAGPIAGPAFVIFSICTVVATLAQYVFSITVVVYAQLAHVREERPDLKECLRQGLVLLLPATGLMTLMALGLMAAYVVFLIPAIILSLVWAVAVPTLVAERKGVFKAFARSADLTRDNRLAIFAVNLVVGVCNLVAVGVYFILFGVTAATAAKGLGSTLNTAALVGIALVSSAITVAMIIANASVAPAVYVELTRTRTGVAGVASVFD